MAKILRVTAPLKTPKSLQPENKHENFNQISLRKIKQRHKIEEIYEQTLNNNVPSLNDELNNYIKEFRLSEYLTTDSR